jgi:ABC-type glycerol-3-phosphate transport system substrate-binding protein
VHIVYAWASFLWAFGGRWLDESGELDLDTPQAIEAATFFTDLLRNYGPPAVSSFGWNENRDLFLRGKAAMSIDATVNGAFNENPEFSMVAGKVGYLPMPKHSKATLKGGQHSLITHQMYLNKYSSNKKAAFVFMSWATSKNVQLKSIQIEPNCGMTSRHAIINEIFYEKFGAFKDTMLRALENGNPKYLPNIPEAPFIFLKVGKALSNVLTHTEKAEAALKKVNHEINEIIKKRSSL